MTPPSVVFLVALAAQAAAGHAAPAPLTLEAAVREAVTAGPAFAEVQDRVELADIQVRAARSRFDLRIAPSMGAGTETHGLVQQNAGLTMAKRVGTGAEISARADSLKYQVGATTTRDTGYSFAITQPLLRGAGVAARADLDRARRAAAATGRSVDEARQDLILRVAMQYFEIVRQQQLVGASERAVDRSRTLVAASEARAKVGLATQLDVLRAQLGGSQAEAALDAQREALLAATDELKLLLGRPLEGDLTVSGGELATLGNLPPAADGRSGEASLIESALANRAAVQNARAFVVDARLAAKIAKWNLLPQIDLTASYTRRGLGGGGEMLNRLWGGWRVGLTSSYALDQDAGSAQAAAAAVSTRAAERAAAASEQRVASEVLRARRSWERAATAIALHEQSVALAEKQRQLATLRYERGLAGNFDIIDAEACLLQAQSALIASRIDRALAAVAVRRATGSLRVEDLR
jgi:outer membrane protein